MTARRHDCQVFVATKADIFKEPFAHFPAMFVATNSGILS